jgi:hypothetical protein
MSGPAFKTGKGFTVTTLLIVLVQPVDVFVPVMVYVVVIVGFAVTLPPVVALRPAEGLHT